MPPFSIMVAIDENKLPSFSIRSGKRWQKCLLNLDGKWWHIMPPFSRDMFQYSTVMANGGKFATVFHQYWKTMAKNISGTWWHNCHRFSPICSNTPSSWQMMANDGQNATIFHSLYQSPVFFTLFHH